MCNYKEIKLTDFYKNDAPAYGAFDNVRKIANYIDGCKLSQRKVLYTLFKKFPNVNTENKTSRLAAAVAECTEYLHGEASLTQVLNTMAASFTGSNNFPLITGHGNFGTRFSGAGSAAAPRYTYCSISPLCLKLFNTDDMLLCESQIFEGTKIEPIYMMPIFPILLLNGTDGISTGWKTTIYPRNPNDILKYIVSILKKDKKLPDIENSIPYFKGFNGKIKFENELNSDGKNIKKIISYGLIEKVNSTTLHIKEIPITYTYASYIKVLDQLEEKGLIENYDDRSDPKTDKFEFFIKVKRSFFETNNNEDLWLKIFSLSKQLTEHFNCIDENNKIKEYSNVKEILDDFITIRLKYYDKRKNYLLKNLKDKLLYLISKFYFIKNIISGDIIVNKRTKDNIISQLEKFNKIIKINDSYDYLLQLQIYSLTSEKLLILKEQIQATEKEYKKIKSQNINDMWLEDLNTLKKFF